MCGCDDAGRGWRLGLSAVEADGATEVGNHHMFGDVQADDTPEDTNPEEPEVDRDARHKAEHGRDAHLQQGTFHARHYGLGRGWRKRGRDLDWRVR